jgi:hypothetical protein
MNSVHIIKLYFFKILFNVILPSTPWVPVTLEYIVSGSFVILKLKEKNSLGSGGTGNAEFVLVFFSPLFLVEERLLF